MAPTHQLPPTTQPRAPLRCAAQGGREGRELGAVELAVAVEALGAGEILLNCIDNDGKGAGFDLELVDAVASAVTIPVIASSGAGCPQHFSQVGTVESVMQGRGGGGPGCKALRNAAGGRAGLWVHAAGGRARGGHGLWRCA